MTQEQSTVESFRYRGRIAALVSALLIGFFLLVGLDGSSLVPQALGVALSYGVCCAVLFTITYYSRRPLTAVYAFLYLLAFGYRVGPQVLGQTPSPLFVDLPLPPQAYWDACFNPLWYCTALVAFVEVLSRMWGDPKPSKRWELWDQTILFGGTLLVALGFLEGLRTGTWTNYGAETRELGAGEFQINFLGRPANIALAVMAMAGLRPAAGPSRSRGLYLGVLLAMVGLLYVSQLRRSLLVIIGMLFLWVLPEPATVAQLVLRPVRFLGALLGVLALLVLFGPASNAWRESSSSFSTNSVSARLTDVAPRVFAGDTTASERFEEVDRRVVYLQTDAAIEGMRPLLRDTDLSEIVFSAVVLATPGAFYADKAQHPPVACENFMANFTQDVDLSCTPSIEGNAVGGKAGIVFAAFLMALLFTVADRLMRTGAAGIYAAVHLVYWPLQIEAQLVTHPSDVRVMLLGIVGAVVCGTPMLLYRAYLRSRDAGA